MRWKRTIVHPLRLKIRESPIWRRNRSARMTATNAVELIEALEAAQIDLWLAGGWGVDAPRPETRPRHDRHPRVQSRRPPCGTDAPRARLPARTGRSRNVSAAHRRRGRRVEIHPIAHHAHGEATTQLQPGIVWTYLPTSLNGCGRIAGREVRCLTAEAQIRAHDPRIYRDVGHDFSAKQSQIDGMVALGKHYATRPLIGHQRKRRSTNPVRAPIQAETDRTDARIERLGFHNAELRSESPSTVRLRRLLAARQFQSGSGAPRWYTSALKAVQERLVASVTTATEAIGGDVIDLQAFATCATGSPFVTHHVLGLSVVETMPPSTGCSRGHA